MIASCRHVMPASNTLRRHRLSIAGILFLCCSCMAAGNTVAKSASRTNGAVRLPVVSGYDIRFTEVSVYGEPFPAEVQDITYDNYGFLWVGTGFGLYRYDGYSLKPYLHDRNDPNSLSDSRIRVVYRDREGILWAGWGQSGRARPAGSG